jgi:hypothetical protein
MQIKSNNPNFDSGPNIGGCSILKKNRGKRILKGEDPETGYC